MGRDLTFSLKLGATLASGFKGVFSGARTQIVGLARSTKALEQSQTGKLGAGFEKSRAKVAGLAAGVKTAKAELAGLQARQKATGGGNVSLARQVAQAQRAVDTQTAALKRAVGAHRETVAATARASGSVAKLRQDYRTLSSQIDHTRKRQQALSANLAKRDALKGERAGLRGGIMDAMAIGATVAVPAKFAVDFEYDMARVGALARASDEDLAKLTAQARQLGRDTPYSASQAAEGMQYLAMAGFNTEKTMAAMPGMLQLAAAGATDLGRTADISSNILSGFRRNASEMGQVSDVLAYTFTSSNTTLESLGDTMKYVGPVAAAMGVSLETASAMVGKLGNVGIQGSQAGTALRSAMLRLAAPPKMAAKALAELTGAAGEELEGMLEDVQAAQQGLKEMGIQTMDAEGNMRPMVDILEDLNKRMEGMGSGQRLEKIKKIFGSEASAAMAELLNQAGQTVDENGRVIVDAYGKQTTALRKYIGEIENSAGTGERIAKKMENTTKGSLLVMRSALEDTAIVAGNVFAPTIRGVAGIVQRGANAVSWFGERFPRVTAVMGGAITAAVGLAVAAKTAAYGYSFLKGGLLLTQAGFLKLAGAQSVSTAATVTNVGAVKGATLAQRTWTATTLIAGRAVKAVTLATRLMNFVFLGSPIGLIAGGIALAAGLIIHHWDKVGPFLSGVLDGITAGLQTAKTYLWDKNPLMIVPRYIVNEWDTITTALAPVFDWLGKKLSWVSDAMSGLGKAWDYLFGDDTKEKAGGAIETVGIAAQAKTAQAAQPAGGGKKAPVRKTRESDTQWLNDEEKDETPSVTLAASSQTETFRAGVETGKPPAVKGRPVKRKTRGPHREWEEEEEVETPSVTLAASDQTEAFRAGIETGTPPPVKGKPVKRKTRGPHRDWEEDEDDDPQPAGVAAVPATSMTRGIPADFAAALPAPAPQQQQSGGGGAAGVSVTVPVSVTAVGLDQQEFTAKMKAYGPELEAFVKKLVERVVKEMEHENRRLSYAG